MNECNAAKERGIITFLGGSHVYNHSHCFLTYACLTKVPKR